jgi:hypothetical protein
LELQKAAPSENQWAIGKGLQKVDRSGPPREQLKVDWSAMRWEKPRELLREQRRSEQLKEKPREQLKEPTRWEKQRELQKAGW